MPLSTMPASISDPRRVGQVRLRYWGGGVVVWIIAGIIISHVTSTARSDPWMQLLAGFVMGGLPSIVMVALLALFRASHSAIVGAACALAALSLLTVAMAADESFGIVYAFLLPGPFMGIAFGAVAAHWCDRERPIGKFASALCTFVGAFLGFYGWAWIISGA